MLKMVSVFMMAIWVPITGIETVLYCTNKIYPLLMCANSLLNFFLVVFSSV